MRKIAVGADMRIDLAALRAAIAADRAAGHRPICVIGTAGTVTPLGIGAGAYAMTHFQVDDFEYYRDVPNPNAVSPEPFLSAGASPSNVTTDSRETVTVTAFGRVSVAALPRRARS